MLKAGDRTAVDGCLATIRFTGLVTGKEGVWVGLEWDDTSRGKNDGSLEGYRYFTCAQLGLCASFLKLESFEQRISPSCSLGEALREKYQSIHWTERKVQSDEGKLAQPGEERIAVQLLEHPRVQGRQADLQQLDRASLHGAGIATVVLSQTHANLSLPQSSRVRRSLIRTKCCRRVLAVLHPN